MADRSDLATLSQELIAQIKTIQIRSQRLASLDLAGEWKSAFKGRGMEFEEVREYAPGDDVRTLDWNVTARSGIPHVKVYREERELTVMLMVDLSASGAFGTGRRLKREVIAEIAAILAYTAVRSNDRVGLMMFSDRIEAYVRPKKGRAHVWRVIRDVLSARGQHRGTDIAGALEHLARTQRRSTVAFVVSDFLDRGWNDAMKRASKRHDLTAVTVTDPRERELPRVGIIELVDSETGERRLVDTLSRHTQTEYARATIAHERRRNHEIRTAGVGHIAVRTDRPTFEPILRYFRGR
ncbi:MAG: DUF58 domain-containing protein [Myxococcota bacterium]